MCPPDYYGIEYEINPWMDRRQAGRSRIGVPAMAGPAAAAGAGRGDDLLHGAGGGHARPGLHGQRGDDLSATWPSSPASAIRSGRSRSRTTSTGWRSTASSSATCRPDTFFEGAGDALFCGDTLFAGYRIRSDDPRPSADRATCWAAA